MRHLILIFLAFRAFAEPIEELIPSGPEEIASLRTEEADLRTTRYTYTSAGRLKTKQLPDGQNLSYEYDSLGHRCRIGDQQIEYDNLGRLVRGIG